MNLIWIIFIISTFFPILVILVNHKNILRKFWPIIGLTNIWVLILCCIGESFALKFKLWHINHDSLSATEILGTQFGNIIFFLIVTVILSVVAIIMAEAEKKGKRFRDVFFKKS